MIELPLTLPATLVVTTIQYEADILPYGATEWQPLVAWSEGVVVNSTIRRLNAGQWSDYPEGATRIRVRSRNALEPWLVGSYDYTDFVIVSGNTPPVQPIILSVEVFA
jgi:hypothetical protein